MKEKSISIIRDIIPTEPNRFQREISFIGKIGFIIVLLFTILFAVLWFILSFSPETFAPVGCLDAVAWCQSNIYLDPENWSVVSIYISNFFHLGGNYGHLVENCIGFIMYYCFIWLVCYLRANEKWYVSKKYFISFGIFCLLVVPLVVSIGHLFLDVSTRIVGASGILYAFIGAGFALSLFPFINTFLQFINGKVKSPSFIIRVFFLWVVFAFALTPFLSILFYQSPESVNVFGHLLGWVSGFLFTFIYDILSLKKRGVNNLNTLVRGDF